MNIICKIALPLGIAGGIWGLLAVVFMAFITPALIYEKTWWYLPLLSFTALMGVLALVALVLSKRRLHLGRILIWVSALAIIVVSFFGLFTWGVFFLSASILLILAAIGLRGEKESYGQTVSLVKGQITLP